MMRLVLVAFAALVPLAAAMGVCYDIYDANNIDKHFRTIRQRFPSVRTYQTSLWFPNGRNVIDAAADNGLSIYSGIWLRDGMDFNKEVQAVIDGARRHPGTLKALFVGNEDLMHGWNQWAIRDKVNEARGRLRGAGINVPVGSVQTDGDWLKARDLANACDIMGVNIYAFFGGAPISWTSPIEDHRYRWNQMTQNFGGKVMLTESGWPFGGGNNGNHVSNWDKARDHFYKVQEWAAAGNGGEMPMYFMYHDNRHKWGYEAQFGLANSDGNWKFEFGWSGGNSGGGGGGGGGGASDKPNGRFQLISSRDKALREWYGGVAAKGNNYDDFTKWTYDANTQLIQNVGSKTCLDAYNDNGNMRVHFYNCDGNNDNQKWRLSNGKVIHAKHNNLCLDADPNDRNEFAQVWACFDNNSNQVFKIVQ